MEVQLTAEQEARLAQVANETGTDTQCLVKNAVLRLLEGEIRSDASLPELPVLHLGAMKSLRRRHLYNDGR